LLAVQATGQEVFDCGVVEFVRKSVGVHLNP
jgi:hypothetical protein